jgi:predicted O-methyltransferase YrrM
LATIPALLPRIRFQRPAATVRGWLTPNEGAALYFLARITRGIAMEIGPWVGRSTICLARGLSDSGNPNRLFSCELDATIDNFRETAPGMIGFFYPVENQVSMGDCPLAEFNLGIKPVITGPGGIVGQLKENLQTAGLSDRVELHLGDFRQAPPRPFDLVFCDAMHNESEIVRNCPDLKRFVKIGGILACHDTDAGNRSVLKRYFVFSEETQVDALFVGRIAQLLEAI